MEIFVAVMIYMAMFVVMVTLSEVSVVVVVSLVMTVGVLQNRDIDVVLLLIFMVASVDPEAFVVESGVLVAADVLAVEMTLVAVTVHIVVDFAVNLGVDCKVVLILLSARLHL